MISDTTRIWNFLLAAASMMAAVCVYTFSRSHPPALIEPFKTPVAALSGHSIFFGSAPSLLYTLSIALLIGLLATSRKSANLNCICWVVLALCLELSQHSSVAKVILPQAAGLVPDSIWQYIGPYWAHGSFDPLDLAATLAGGLIAAVALNCIPRKHADETD